MSANQSVQNDAIARVLRLANGTRKFTKQSRQNDELVKEFTYLEDYEIKERWELLDILRRVGHKFGLTPELYFHLDYLFRLMGDNAWVKGGQPICFKSVIAHAQDLNISERTVRHRERRLSDLGFLTYHDSPNGRRYSGGNNKETAYGVSLIPLVMRNDEIREMDYAERQRKEQWKKCRKAIGCIRRKLLSLMKVAIQEGQMMEQAKVWASKFEQIKMVRASDDLEELQGRLDVYNDLKDEIETALLTEDELCKTSELTHDIAATAETDCRRIDTHTDSHLSFGDYCNDPVDEKGETSPRVNVFREDKGESRSSGAEYLLPNQVYEAACSDFRDAVDRVSGNAFPSDLTVQNIVSAGDYLKNYLSISSGTWQRALSELGQYGAAIGLMLACRPHIRSSNAYMIGLLKRHRKGDLHLQKTVFGQLVRTQ